MISFITGFVIIIYLAYMSLIYESTSLVRLTVAGAMFLVTAAIYLIFRRRRLKCRITAPYAIADAGKEIRLCLMVKNDSRFLTDNLRILIRYSDNIRVRKKWVRVICTKTGENSISVPVTLSSAGCYQFKAVKGRIYDKTGFFYISKRFSSSTKLMVLPELKNVSVRLGERVRNFYGDSDIYDDIRPGRDPGEIFDIREFREGDKVQRINWKLSAKKDELLVREDSLPKACPIVIFYSFKNIGDRGYRAEKSAEELSNIASISFALMTNGCPHYMVWQSESRRSLVRVRIDDEESFFLAMTEGLSDSVFERYDRMSRDYKEKYRGEIHISDIYTDDGKLMLDNEELPSRDGLIDIVIK